MVSKFAATVFAALGLTGAPQGHVAATLHGYARSEHSAARQALPAIFVTGHGWGHGVGLAQYGTYGYALHGWSADKIVAHIEKFDQVPALVKSEMRHLLADHICE